MTNEENELKEKMEEIERQTLKELNAPCDATLEDDEIKMIQEVNAVIAAYDSDRQRAHSTRNC